jgi:cobalt-precorrin-7 (C5)-methyltransferase
MPEDIAAELVGTGVSPSLETLVLERLTHTDESIARQPLGELAAETRQTGPDGSLFSDLSVLAIKTRSIE